MEQEAANLWRVHKTVNQMVHDRGYIVSQASLDLAFPEFVQAYGNGSYTIDRNLLTFLVQKKDDPSVQLFVFFPEDLTVGVKPIRTFCERMVEQNVYRAIVVVRNNITPSASKIMASMAPKYILEQFLEIELMINITEHQLVPKHILLTEAEKQELHVRYRLKEGQLPRILTTDPISRYYGYRRSQVVKIIRDSETAGRYVTYRLVV